LAFEDGAHLGGDSPWEVPWGKLFGAELYTTLHSVYTGYGEKVSQGKIRNRGMGNMTLLILAAKFLPLQEYMSAC
jgi:hypothetical protein